MDHPAFLRASTTLASKASRWLVGRSGWRPLELAKLLFRRANRGAQKGYRPELHYMRGGRTAGARSLAAG